MNYDGQENTQAKPKAKRTRPKTYSEKLKDPRWQKLRLKVLERDGWQCLFCDEEGETLHVHHRYYEKGKDPWDYPDDCFQTLCKVCHEDQEDSLLNLRKEISWLSSGYVDGFAFLAKRVADEESGSPNISEDDGCVGSLLDSLKLLMVCNDNRYRRDFFCEIIEQAHLLKMGAESQ